jgi:2-hydroxymuconate-semialdehyde hydrolase
MLASEDARVTRVLTTGTMGTSFPCKPGTRLWRYPEGRDALRQSVNVTVWNEALIDDAELDYRLRILTQPGYREYYESMFEADKQHYIDASALTPAQLGRIKAKVLMMHGRQDRSFPPQDTALVLLPSLPAADLWLIAECAHSVALEHPEKFLSGAALLFR